MIWFTVSTTQLKKDQRQLAKYIEEEPGYDRSPNINQQPTANVPISTTRKFAF